MEARPLVWKNVDYLDLKFSPYPQGTSLACFQQMLSHYDKHSI